MKLSAYSLGGRIVASLLVIVLMAGCGGDGKKTDKDAKGGSGAITMPKAVKTPPGADPSVPAEMGGSGFEKIAADSGWQTGTISPDQFKYIADPAAKKGGELRWAEQDYPATFRPYGKDASSTTIQMIYSLVYETLITTNPLNLEFLPVLASHWKIDPDGQTFYFRIDPNARFSDGTPVTSEDIIATCQLLADSTLLDPFYTTMIKKYDAPIAVSKYILKVRSKEKEWKAMLYFGGLPILPAKSIAGMSGTDFIAKYQYNLPPGSGPYIVLPEDVKKQKSVTLTRIADWWQGEYPINKGQNNFDKLKMSSVEDDNLRYEKYRNGEYDFYFERRAQWWVTKFDYEDIKAGKEQKRRIYTDNPQGIQGFGFNMRRAPFSDVKVREAFIHLFNREQLIEKIMYNQYTVSDSYFPNSPYENKNNPKYRYDPQLAAKLLDEAGYNTRNSDGIRVKNGKPFVIELPITKGSEHLMGPIQQELQRAGIKMNIRNVDFSQLNKLMDERNFDLVYIAYSASVYPNPRNQFGGELADVPNTNNITGIKNAKLDQLIKLEYTTYDQGKRVAIIQQIDSILMDTKAYALAWYAPFQRLVYYSYVKQPNFYLTRIGDWRSLVQLWWMDKENPTTKPGEVDVKFWPDYDAAHPPTYSANYESTSTPAKTGGDSGAAKPSIK